MFVLTGCSVGSVAGAQCDLAQVEVVPELGPFGVGGFAVLLARAAGAALVHEAPVVADHLFRIDNGDLRYSNCRNAWPTAWFVG